MTTNGLLNVSKDEATRAYYESELIFELDQRGKIRKAVEEERIKNAKSLLDILNIETIAKKFQLSIEEVEALKEQPQ